MGMNLFHGDCIEVMKSIPDNSIDLCLTDPPYGTTACKWDTVIPFEPMWKELKRIVKDNGAICLFGNEPFSSHLRMSNIKMFKYDWYWCKSKASGHLNAKKMPMQAIEIICVLYKRAPRYIPQGTIIGNFKNGRPSHEKSPEIYGKQKRPVDGKVGNYPKNVLNF